MGKAHSPIKSLEWPPHSIPVVFTFDTLRLILTGAVNRRTRTPRTTLVRAIVQARRWQSMLASGDAASIQHLAQREQVCPIYTGQLLPLAFLAPDLIEAIIDGRQPARLSLISLINARLPMRWDEQRALFARFA